MLYYGYFCVCCVVLVFLVVVLVCDEDCGVEWYVGYEFE